MNNNFFLKIESFMR